MLDRNTTGCFQTTPFSYFLAFSILFLASHFVTALFLLLFCLQHSKTWSEREGAEVGFAADREVSDRPWLPWVCARCMGIRSSHICPCYLCSTNKTRQIPAQRLFVGNQLDKRERDKVKTSQHSHNFLGPHLHCKHERPRPVSLTLVEPGNKRAQVQRPSVTARLAPLQPAFLPLARRLGPVPAAPARPGAGAVLPKAPHWQQGRVVARGTCS